MKRILIAGAVAMLALPAVAGASAPATPKSPAEQCRALQASMGAQGFKQEFGTNASKSNAFGKCVARQVRQDGQNRQNAAQQCRAERSDQNFAATHNGQTFAQFYGTNANDRNAYGRCVSTKARAKSAEQQQAQVTSARNAARQCRTERADAAFAASHGGKTFAQFYGTNGNARNAFGKCVSRHARA